MTEYEALRRFEANQRKLGVAFQSAGYTCERMRLCLLAFRSIYELALTLGPEHG